MEHGAVGPLKVRSMTGFGSAAARGPFGVLQVEVRAVNHRYLDVAVHLPRGLSGLEAHLVRVVRQRLVRGRIDVRVNAQDSETVQRKVRVQSSILTQYWQQLSQIQRELGIAGSISLGELVTLPEVVAVEESESADPQLVEAACGALEEALQSVEAMREAEGARLWQDIEERLDRIQQRIERLHQLAGEVVRQYALRLEGRVAALLSAAGSAEGGGAEALACLRSDETWQRRLAQEVAVLAERADVTEELTRLASHVSQMRALARQVAGGRRMEFLVREMDREAATAASKVTSSEMVHELIEVRWEIERIREQVLNLE